LKSNEFELEWPPRSGRKESFPEVDRAEWFSPAAARRKILPAQSEFIARLLTAIAR
jgi:predicted NUDIX family NTP pyrophosphohydrolase